MVENRMDQLAEKVLLERASQLSPEKRALLSLRLEKKRGASMSTGRDVAEDVLKIRDRLMILSDGLLDRYGQLMYRAKEGGISEAEITETLEKIEEELAALRRKVENGEIVEASLATAKMMLRDGLTNVIDLVQDPVVQRVAQHFIIDHLAAKLLSDPVYKFTQDWFYYHSERWGKHFGHLAGEPHLRFLEVGCFEGRCTCWLLENILTHETSTIVCVDPFTVTHPRQEEYFDFNIGETGGAYKVVKLRGGSQDVLKFLSPESYDFIYVDGSHYADDVLQDAVLCWRLLKRDGVIVFDDYEAETIFPGLMGPMEHAKYAIDAFLSLIAHQHKVIFKGWQVALAKLY
jgi:predicted O-methyltransferase YrrM